MDGKTMATAGALAATIALGVFAAQAETYYLKRDTGNVQNIFTTNLGTYWKTADGTAATSFTSADIGRIEAGTLGVYQSITFPGATLHLGAEDGTKTGSLHLRNLGFTVADCRWHSGAFWRNYGGATPTVSGNIHLDCPDGLHAITNGNGGGTGIIFSFPCVFSCDEPAVDLKLLQQGVGASCMLIFSGDNAAYRGRISQLAASVPFVIASANALGDPVAARSDALNIGVANASFAVLKGTLPNAARGIAINSNGFKLTAKVFEILNNAATAVRTTVDCSDYELPMPISGAYGFAKDGEGTVTLSGAYTAGAVVVQEGALRIAAAAALPAAHPITVKSGARLLLRQPPERFALTVETGGMVALEADYDAATKVAMPVALPATYAVPSGGQPIALSEAVALPQHEALSLEVLTIAAGAADVTADDFTDVTPKTYGLPKTTVMVEKDADGVQHVYLATYPVVKSVGAFYTVDGTSKTAYLTVNGQADKWSDGQAAHAGADYLLVNSMNSLSNIEFDGDSLTVSIPAAAIGGTTLHVRETKTRLTATLYPPTIIRPNYDGRSFNVYGDWTIAGGFDDAAPYVTLCSRYKAGGYLAFDGALHGEGPMKLSAADVGTLALKNGVNKTCLNGDNSDFTGRIYVTHEGSPTNEYVGTQFGFNSAAALGGAPDTFKADALTLDKYSMMCPSADVTFETANRGISGTGPYGFNVPEGVTFAVKVPIWQNNTMYKTGAGTLALGGAISFGTNDLCRVREGGLTALADAAVAGLDCTFSDGASIVLSPRSTAVNGFTKVAVEDGGTVHVALAAADGVDGVLTLPVCTVPAADADLTGSLALACAKGYRATLVKQHVTVDGVACVRYSACYAKEGLTILFR